VTIVWHRCSVQRLSRFVDGLSRNVDGPSRDVRCCCDDVRVHDARDPLVLRVERVVVRQHANEGGDWVEALLADLLLVSNLEIRV